MNIIIWLLATLVTIGLLYVNRIRIVFALGWIWPSIIAAWAWIRNHIFYFFCMVVMSLLATTAGMIFEIPWLTGLGMLIAISLLLAVWTPVGISLRLFRITDQVYPQYLGKVVLV